MGKHNLLFVNKKEDIHIEKTITVSSKKEFKIEYLYDNENNFYVVVK